jgi:DNA-binding NtrC family response regulator
MRAVYSAIDKVARTDFPVLITGKSGTGKELVAKAIHDKSGRASQSLVVVNCGALTPSLIQSELFGHEKGSFTSAEVRKEGHFELAHGGTIFLDEIAELPLDTQANLLRVLEEKSLRRVGGCSSIPADVRVIAATNLDLSEAVEARQFREDLLYRLSVVRIEIPSLCERLEDIEELANYYLERLTAEVGSTARGFSRQAVEAMLAYNWPGNVRELINRIKSAAVMCENHLIRPDDLGLADRRTIPKGSGGVDWMTLRKVREEAERNALRETMRRANSNISLAAERLGVSRVTLYNLLKKHQMR